VQAGIYHAVGADDASRADLAQGVFERAAALCLHSARVKPIITPDYLAPVRYPVNYRLDSAVFAWITDLQPLLWAAALQGVMADIMGASTSVYLGVKL
jgi:dTDP-4-dehydrorhamnose reductase